MADKGKRKADEREKRPVRGGNSRGGRTRGRRPLNIPPPPPNVIGSEFDALFQDEEIPNIEIVGGDREASLSFSDLDENPEIEIHIPSSGAEQLLNEENQREQGNPRPSSSRSTGFLVDVEGKYN